MKKKPKISIIAPYYNVINKIFIGGGKEKAQRIKL